MTQLVQASLDQPERVAGVGDDGELDSRTADLRDQADADVGPVRRGSDVERQHVGQAVYRKTRAQVGQV